ncbi:hypothetical protein ACH0B6_17050 [Solibacillus silvestris]
MTSILKSGSVKKTVAVFTLIMMALMLYSATGMIDSADAANNAANLVGVKKVDDDGKGLIEEGKGLVYLMMAGGFVIVAGCIVVAAIKLSAAGNGQKRAEAMMWVGGCFVGGFLIYKAFDLLGYAISFGS